MEYSFSIYEAYERRFSMRISGCQIIVMLSKQSMGSVIFPNCVCNSEKPASPSFKGIIQNVLLCNLVSKSGAFSQNGSQFISRGGESTNEEGKY